MSAKARSLLQYANREVGFQLFQPDGAREARRTATDDGDFILHESR